ncbi:hypothetical protein GCM10007864_05690 [Sinorhizobium fredii]|nr:hypothetical protein GCM10007864_05690 [Sinorhizobium fredii]
MEPIRLAAAIETRRLEIEEPGAQACFVYPLGKPRPSGNQKRRTRAQQNRASNASKTAAPSKATLPVSMIPSSRRSTGRISGKRTALAAAAIVQVAVTTKV